MDEFSLSSFQNFAQNAASAYLNTRTQAQYNGALELQKMELLARNSYGLPYIEGQAGGMGLPAPGFAGIPASWLLIGGLVLAVVLLKDD